MIPKTIFAEHHRHFTLHLLLALVLAAVLKIWLVSQGVLPFNSDEAIVALMARHILQGEMPIFFYGQSYMGSFDAFLVAAGFSLFGEHVWVIRFVQGLLYAGVLVTGARLGEVVFGSKCVGALTAWFLAIPNVILTLYTTVSLGGYVEALLLGNVILLTGLSIEKKIRLRCPVPGKELFLWGVLAGFGLWVFGLTLIYSIPVGVLLLARLFQQTRDVRGFVFGTAVWRFLAWVALGFTLGAAPWWVYAAQHGFQHLVMELGGSAVNVEQASWLLRALQHTRNLILFGGTAIFGMRPSWAIEWLGLPLLPAALAFWVGVVVHTVTRVKSGQPHRFEATMLVGVMLVFSAAFVFTPFGVDPSGRYFVPLMVLLSLFAADMIVRLADQHGSWAYGLLLLILAYHAWGIVQSAERYPPGLTTQFLEITQVNHDDMEELIAFLTAQDEMRGYTNYWVAYPLAFLSDEELIFIPRLPYHEDFRYTPRDDRYRPYDDLVEQAGRVAYITTKHPLLNDVLREAFASRNATWDEVQIGDYSVFYNLSKVIRPDEIPLEERAP